MSLCVGDRPVCSAFQTCTMRRSQLPCGLRRTSAAARLQRLWVRIPPGAWMSVCCECWVCRQAEFSATSWSLVQRSPTECGASLCVIYKPREWGSSCPLRVVAPDTNKVKCGLVFLILLRGFPWVCSYYSNTIVNLFGQTLVEWILLESHEFRTDELIYEEENNLKSVDKISG